MGGLSTKLLPMVLLATLGALVLILNEVAQVPGVGRPDRPNEPDLIAQNATAYRFDVNGKRLSRVYADRLRHYPAGDTNWLDQPRIHYTKPDTPEVTVVGKRARTEQNGTLVWFPDDAKLTRAPSADKPQLDVVSSDVWVKPNENFVWSKTPVNGKMGAYTVSGVGFNADMDKETLELLSKVSTTYVPPPPRR
ncbi:LPS export ABC transporter periplasmic protein LptC [Jeongeupia naejangsanensis]|uniref:LPS export ABC transporter periplasmic protein LptC n=1 Tax=Jeongeupia naejangsanensis TaxID=613195 RepID=A0ABS2BK63_9NEIS|nr:LPS export ABC transporter periplasmic protein LptC [Jeongeupia naejangsanensis]MBM3115978.1 LPS export ABC transporter periplasmic protein LptC [Jeongeupia naejangsanensis]